ncbi:hypothetical protein B0H34DRAFT_712210 [Crassisporium funariophilum]|nr:hypothetical protein B0H34DRAFT_712210 [Crassisporium funariophilum]
MILPQENEELKARDSKSAVGAMPQPAPVSEDDPPPSYTISPVVTPSTSSPYFVQQQPLPSPPMKPANFVGFSRLNGSVKGSWLIDPSLLIPATFLPPLAPSETEATRRNLFLQSMNGSVDVDVYLATSNRSSIKQAGKYLLIHTQSSNGSVRTRLHDTACAVGNARLPVRLSSFASNGSIHVQLPRSFRGPIRIKTWNGSTHFSDVVQGDLTPFSEIDRIQRSFLGHFNPSEWDVGAEWEGDELFIEARNGSVKVFYDDETDAIGRPKSQGFLAKLFSF